MLEGELRQLVDPGGVLALPPEDDTILSETLRRRLASLGRAVGPPTRLTFIHPTISATPAGARVAGPIVAFGVHGLRATLDIGPGDAATMTLTLDRGTEARITEAVSWTALDATLQAADGAADLTATFGATISVDGTPVPMSLRRFTASPRPTWELAFDPGSDPSKLARLVSAAADAVHALMPELASVVAAPASVVLTTGSDDARLAVTWPIALSVDIWTGHLSATVAAVSALLVPPVNPLAPDARWAPAFELHGDLSAFGSAPTDVVVRATVWPLGVAMRVAVVPADTSLFKVANLFERLFGEDLAESLRLPAALSTAIGDSALSDLTITTGPEARQLTVEGGGTFLGWPGRGRISIYPWMGATSVAFELLLNEKPDSLAGLVQSLGIPISADLADHLPTVAVAPREIHSDPRLSLLDVGGTLEDPKGTWALDVRVGLGLPGGITVHAGSLYGGDLRPPALTELLGALTPKGPFDAGLWSTLESAVPQALHDLVTGARVHDCFVSWFPPAGGVGGEQSVDLVCVLPTSRGELVCTLELLHRGAVHGLPPHWELAVQVPFLRLDLHDLLATFGLPDAGIGFAHGTITVELDRMVLASDGVSLDLEIEVNGRLASLHASWHKVAGGARWDLGLTVAGWRFALDVTSDAHGTRFHADLDGSAEPIRLRELVTALGVDDLPAYLDLAVDGVDLTFEPKSSGVGLELRLEVGGHQVDTAVATTLLPRKPPVRAAAFASKAAELHFGFDQVPVIGPLLPRSLDLGVTVKELTLRYTSPALTRDELRTLAALLPDTAPALAPAGDGDIAAGLALSGKLVVAGSAVPISSEAGAAPAGGPAPAGAAAARTDGSDPLAWKNVGRAVGPVHLDQVGVGFAGGNVLLGVTGSLRLSVLELALVGLRLDVPIAALTDPAQLGRTAVHLDGLGIQVDAGSVSIGGALVRHAGRLDGSALVRAGTTSLQVLASLETTASGDPSVFMYGVLRAQIGGPAFFFVTGIAAGFGYNRDLRLPDVEQLADFVLVKSATGLGPAPASTADLITMLEAPDTQRALPVEAGSMFLAAGIKFTTFKILDSFVLVTVSFGHGTTIGIIGSTTLELPPVVPGAPATPPLAHIQLVLKATYAVERGTLDVRGLLVGSYILSHDCTLTGGFAVFAQFKDVPKGARAGDFVATIGGYHPHFKPEDWYPSVPRLALSWRVSDHLHVKGTAYFALTPKAAMAGGGLDAVWEEGRISARFHLAADFLVSWEPYHYEASLTVAIRGSADLSLFSVSISVSASVDVYGPPFGGRAEVDLGICSATITFGPARPPRVPLSTDAFVAKFLPHAADVCAASVSAGAVRHDRPSGIWTVNGNGLAVDVQSAVPVTSIHPGSLDALRAGSAATGLPALDLPGSTEIAGTVQVVPAERAARAPLAYTVTRLGPGGAVDVTGHFRAAPLSKSVPTAMWQAHKKTDSPTVGSVSGVRLEPSPVAPPPHTGSLDEAALRTDLLNLHEAAGMAMTSILPAHPAVAGAGSETDVAGRRRALLVTLGYRDVLKRNPAPAAAPAEAVSVASLAVPAR